MDRRSPSDLHHSTDNYEHQVSEVEFEILKAEVARTGSFEATVVSPSMAPVIRPGDTVKIEPIPDFSRLRQFDILVHWDGKVLLCHYLRHRNEHFKDNGEAVYVTRGLRSGHEDLPVTRARILGKVAQSIPWYFKLWEVLKPSARR